MTKFDFSVREYIKSRWDRYFICWLSVSAGVCFLVWLNNQLTIIPLIVVFLFSLIVTVLCFVRKLRVLGASSVEVASNYIKYTLVKKRGIDVIEAVFEQRSYNIYEINKCEIKQNKVILYGNIQIQVKNFCEKVPYVKIPMFFENKNELQQKIKSFYEENKK